MENDAKKDGYDAECEEEVGSKNFHFHRYPRRRRSIDRSLISYYHLTSDTHTRCTLAIIIAIQLATYYHEALVLQLPLLLLPRVVIIVAKQHQRRRRRHQPCVLGLCFVDDIMAIASAAAVTLPKPAATITKFTWHGGGK